MRIWKKALATCCTIVMFVMIPALNLGADELHATIPLNETIEETAAPVDISNICQTESPNTIEDAELEVTEAVDSEAVLGSKENIAQALSFSQSKIIDDITVTVEADSGVFPSDAVLSVTKVSKETKKAIADIVEEVRDANAIVAVSYTFDISILDSSGNELQPYDDQNITVSFSSVKVDDPNLTADIYHISDEGEIERLEIETLGDQVSADTDGFSYYTVEFTYNKNQYVLQGDESVALGDILEVIGLIGEVTDVECSNQDLFSAEYNGEWIVTANQAFTSEEWMKVTINGIKYEIVVTDSSYGVNLNSPGYATNINPFTAKGYYGQCTWYCWGRAYEKGVSLSWGNGSFGNAIDWYRNAAGNYVCDQTPSANSIMVSPDGGYNDSNGNYHQTGHVMFVEKVEGGYAYITEGNYNGQNYHEDWIQLSTGRRNWGSGAAFSITGYIHLPDGGNYLNLGDDFYANIAATGFDNWIFLENHGGNVQLWDKANDYSDTRLQWHFLRQQDGSYRIISMYDGRYLNAHQMGSAGYNVCVYSYLDWEAQNWFIIRNGNWYGFVPKYDTQICLDVTNAAVAGGTNIQLWNRSDGSEAQLFDIYKYDLEKYPLALNLGDDFYANIAATGFDNWIFLENHAGNVQLWDKQNDYTDTRLQWHFVRQQDGSYRIINMYDGRYLNAHQMGSAGYNVCVYSYLDWEAQSWFIIRNGNWYSFVPKYDMQICLDVTNAAVVGGTNIQLWNRSAGSEAQLFDIYKFDYTPVNISGAEISFIDNYVYTGKPIEPSPDVKIGDLLLIYDKHYTVSYSNNTNVGRATVIITGTGAYTGTITKAFSITKATPGLYFASASLSKKTGDADFTNTLTKTTDGAVTFKSSNTSVATVNSTSGKVTIKGAGTATITATAAEGKNYKSGSASYTLTVTASKTDISICTVALSSTSYTYNGQAKKPSVTVTNGSTTLAADTDYTVSYSNNTNAGTATVTITGKGDYTGTNSATFTIKQAAAKLTFANASISKTVKDAAFTNALTKTTDGTVTFKSSNTSVATINSTSGLVTIKGAGTATLTATASAGTNYKAGSASYTLTVTAPSPAGFSDVQDPSHPYYKAIYWAAEKGITKGYSDGTFGIDRSCTRGEMMMFLWKYAGKPAPKAVSTSPFSDVTKSHTFYNAILWGYQKGITKGYSDGTFGVNRNVTRGESMMFLWKLKGKKEPTAVPVSPFKDVPKAHTFYKAILWGYQKGITKGYTSGANAGNFGVNDNCTRGQIVTFLYRIK